MNSFECYEQSRKEIQDILAASKMVDGDSKSDSALAALKKNSNTAVFWESRNDIECERRTFVVWDVLAPTRLSKADDKVAYRNIQAFINIITMCTPEEKDIVSKVSLIQENSKAKGWSFEMDSISLHDHSTDRNIISFKLDKRIS